MGTPRRSGRRAVGISVGLLLGVCPATAVADTQLITNCPQITETNGVILGNTATECATQDNYQYNATPDAANFPAYPYPWDDEFYGPALIMGGFGPHAGGPR